MFVYHFAKPFAELVASGQKRQTFRKIRRDGRAPEKGDHLRMIAAPYSKDRRVILEAACTRVEPVRIECGWMWFKQYNQWQAAHPKIARKIAARDGFSDFDAFLDYFTGRNRDHRWRGHLIHFRPMREDELAEISTQTKKGK